MRDGRPSRTAQHVAAYRLAFERLPAPTGEPDADERLARDVSDGCEFEPDARMANYLRARTRFFDRVVVNALDRGTTQIVTIGAGYDGRALRYAMPGVRWFELDHPATQRDKIRRLERLEIPTSNLTFVAADLADDDIVATLLGAGFTPDAPSLMLCEGVAVYLTPEVLAGLLAQLRSLATAGTRLAMSAGIPGADPGRRERFADRVAGMGEPVTLAGTDAETFLTTAHWRAVELSDRAQRLGLLVGVPVWEPGSPPTVSRIGAYLERTFHRSGMERLAQHLAATYGIRVVGSRRLDVGVVRIDHADGAPWVARVFPAARPLAASRADADVLRFLAECSYPAERIADPDPVSEHAGQAVLVTQFVDGKAPPATPATFRQFGEMLGRLHQLPGPPSRSGGAWHHLAFEGGPGAEIAALRTLLDASVHVPAELRRARQGIQEQVDALDDLHDLPQAFTHPDFVTANAIIDPTDGPIIIDWAGAGIAPRLWTIAFLLWSAGRSGPRHIDATVDGYRRYVTLDAVELDRLEPAVAARPLIFDAWTYATARRRLDEVMAGRPQVDAKAREIGRRARAAFERAS